MLSCPLALFLPKPELPSRPTGRDAQARGAASELRALRLARTLPSVTEARLGTASEDHEGVDLVLTLGARTLSVQVKSSPRAAEKFRARYPDRPILLVGDRPDEDVTRDLASLVA